MAYYRKIEIVEAVQYEGTPLAVIHEQLGEQRAETGDWLLGTKRGKIRVVKAQQFQAEYEPYKPTPAEVKTLEAADAPPDEAGVPVPASEALTEPKPTQTETVEEEEAEPLREHPVSAGKVHAKKK